MSNFSFNLLIGFVLAFSSCQAQIQNRTIDANQNSRSMIKIKEDFKYVHVHGMPKKGKILMVASSTFLFMF